ncbi:MAG: hemolysin family protein [Gemmatimonadota bacterium]|nr:hemolysin family protein [Gemmatimonadota bacterium]
MIWGTVAVVALLLLLSATLTLGEAAAFQLGTSRLRTLESEGFRGSGALTEVRIRGAGVQLAVRLFTRILNLAAVAITAVGTASTGSLWSSGGGVVLAVLTVLLVGDLLPQMLATRHPVRFALTLAPLLLFVARQSRFLTSPVERLEERLRSGSGPTLSNEQRELREIQEIGSEEGVLEASENLLVERAFRLDELTAWEVMIPRVDMFAWAEDTPLSEIIDDLPDVPYSRVPVYRDSIDDVTGIVYVREAYERYARGEHDLPLGELARAPFFVPGSLSLTQLLTDFQARRIHMGIVADEFGGTDGLVTLEDVLEELVGEIQDETDVEEEGIERVSHSIIECDGSADTRDLNALLGVELPNVEHRSVNGFILEELGHVPATGDDFERAGVRIEIVDATETQVVRARLTRLDQQPAEREDS